jgi:hypothetical protein
MGILLYPAPRALQSQGNEQAQNSRKFGQAGFVAIALTIVAFTSGVFVGSKLNHSETTENMVQATATATAHGRFGRLTH